LNFIINYLKQFISIVAILYIISCAAIQGPPGGSKDETPPELIQTIPDDGTIHFDGGRVELIFSEYLDASSIEKSIRVLPTLFEDPEIVYKGRRVFVEFPDSLNENQTYIISIDRNLKDEHKVALEQGIQIAFTTGDKIDEGNISGNVTYGNPSSVHLWKIQHENDLTEFYQRVPDYVIDASDSGRYQFNYLSKGNYRLAAVDRSASGIPISPERMVYGLPWKPLLQIQDSISIQNINIQVPSKMGGIKMIQAEWQTGYWGTVTFSEKINEWVSALKIHAIYEDSSIHQPTQFLDITDETKLHLTFPNLEENKYITLVANGIMQGEETILDSGFIKVKVDTTIDTTNLSIKAPLKNFVLTIEEEKIVPLQIIFSSLINIEKSQYSISISKDTLLIPFELNWISKLHVEISPVDNWVQQSNYQLSIIKNKLHPLVGKSIKDSLKTVSFSTSKFKGFGRLIGSLTAPFSGKLVAEVTSMEKEPSLFRTVVNSDGIFNMNHLPEGNYSLLFFNDLDGNTTYTYGRIHPYKPSEWFYNYPDTVKIRTNWDLELKQINLELNP
jgi:hypothetical protein